MLSHPAPIAAELLVSARGEASLAAAVFLEARHTPPDA